MNQKSFTLIEILVVIVVIGILSSFILVGMSSITNSANTAKAQAFSSSLKNSLLMNLIAEWKLDGNANDSWGSNNGTINNATTINFNCVSGSCLSFDSDGDYVTVSHRDEQMITDKITMEAWIKTSVNQTDLYPFIMSKYWRYVISGDQGNNKFRFALSGVGTLITSNNLPLNNWNHVVGTYDKDGGSNNIKIYVNGLLSTQTTMTGSFLGSVTNDLFIGIADIRTMGFLV
ncbi:MAG: LamG domain-containing protein [Candidatus Pacebacteria bacterium]|nr:LamG domain-containing protein [Candidatus Paceibacterota bacterium]